MKPSVFSALARLAPVAASVLVLGCAAAPAPPVQAPAAEPVPSITALRDELMRVDADFSALSVARGAAEAFRTYLADDATEIQNGGDFVRGKVAIAADLAPPPGKTLTMHWEPLEAQVSSSGDLGYTFGRYTLEITGADGARKAAKGKYMTVWRRQRDGAWKATVDMGNASP